MIISWFSAGITSAVACKLAVENLEDVRLFYIETGSHHADNLRFLADCEKWIGREIEIVQSKRYTDVSDVILSRRFINSPGGASCTDVLKKQVRRDLHRKLKPSAHVMGFEYEKSEIERANNFRQRHPEANFIFPLIDFRLSKNECAGIISLAGIKFPEMYLLGYEHNNCIGCVKGGMGYWNKIRRDLITIQGRLSYRKKTIGTDSFNEAVVKLNALELLRRKEPKGERVESQTQKGETEPTGIVDDEGRLVKADDDDLPF